MRQQGLIEKGWGHELIFASTDRYCGKILHFNKDAKCSLHFHADKEESWYILEGQFRVVWMNTSDCQILNTILNVGDTWHNKVLVPHQLICLEAGRILEVSSPDSIEDNYRIMPGDSQL